MEYAYDYSAKTGNGQILSGIMYSPSKPMAYAKLKKAGFMPLKVEINYLQSISATFKTSFDKRELARFYGTVGTRLNNGKPLVKGLDDAIEYVNDARLRQAIMLMKQSIIDGQKESDAMIAAGFPRRDCLVIKSTGDTGKVGQTFVSLGDELKRKEQLRAALVATFRMPKIMAIFMISFIWAALVFIAPMTLAFLKQTGLKIKFSPLLENYFKLVEIFSSAPVICSIIYVGLFALIAIFIKSSTFKNAMDSIKTLKDLSMKSDHAALWNSFGLLYDAAVPAKEACIIVGDSASRDDSRAAFYKMGKLIESGRSLEDAVSSAGFPRYIVSGVSSATSGGDIGAGIKEMVVNLHSDTETLTTLLQENAKVMSVLGMGVGVLVVFIMTYYPMLASVMSNV